MDNQSPPKQASAEKKVLTQRKNFMQDTFSGENTLQKREEFAVSLRKQKTKQIIDQKRRKITMAQDAVQSAGQP